MGERAAARVRVVSLGVAFRRHDSGNCLTRPQPAGPRPIAHTSAARARRNIPTATRSAVIVRMTAPNIPGDMHSFIPAKRMRTI